MYRRLIFATAVVAIAITGCSTTKQVVPNPSKSASSSATSSSSASPTSSSESSAPAARLDSTSCVEITQANVDLATATNAEAARTAGNAFEKYDLPAEVKDAVEHFVSTGGAQFDDPNYDKYNNAIEGWIKQVCPL